MRRVAPVTGTDRCDIIREPTEDQILARIAEAGGVFWHEMPEEIAAGEKYACIFYGDGKTTSRAPLADLMPRESDMRCGSAYVARRVFIPSCAQ